MKKIEKFTFGMGDRFAQEGRAQLQAVVSAKEEGILVVPVWNKSNREHTIVGSEPDAVLAEARDAVQALKWTDGFHVDADHINLGNVDRFLAASDFYTIDVAEHVAREVDGHFLEAFLASHRKLVGVLTVPGLPAPLTIAERDIRSAAGKFLRAVQEAGRIYRHIRDAKGADDFITEVSVDETDVPQTPVELLLILVMLAHEGVPAQTIAPKFTGRFNKGVDYSGNLEAFAKEFEEDLCVVAYAVGEFGLPETLKLSVHSGSDKFSLYPVINRLVKKHGAGLHVKTAGTTWLEEVIGLAEAGGDGLALVKEVYAEAMKSFDALVAPYAPVVDIDPVRLPAVETVMKWSGHDYAAALRHDQKCPEYNPHFRQFIHVSFKVAAKMGGRYIDSLKTHREIVARGVTANLLDRHIRPIFG